MTMCGKNQLHLTRHGFLQDHAIAEIPHCNQRWHPEKNEKRADFALSLYKLAGHRGSILKAFHAT